MSIRPIALCFGSALTPRIAVTAHGATYDVTVLADPGGVGPAMLPPPSPIGGDTKITPSIPGLIEGAKRGLRREVYWIRLGA